ncbi:hypothetical protein VTH82DRAFT_5783 [Thermothelomyces myriococcoides]
MSGDRANQVYVKGFGRRRFHFPESGLHRSLTRLDPKAVVDRDEGAASTSPLEELGNDLSSWNREAAAAAPSSWVCKRCLAGQKSQIQPRNFYHDDSLLSSRAASPSSPIFGFEDPRCTGMSPSTTASTKSGSSFTSPRIDPGAPIINCSYPGCAAKIDGKRQVLCEAHLHVISKTDKYRDCAQENGTHTAQTPKGTFGIPLQTLSSTNPRQLLPNTAKDRPITGLKPAGNPPHAQQQLAPKHGTIPYFRGESVMTPTSVRPLAPRPPAHSPAWIPSPIMSLTKQTASQLPNRALRELRTPYGL